MLAGERATDAEACSGHGDAVDDESMRRVVGSGRNARVVMMQSADVANLDDTAAIDGMVLAVGQRRGSLMVARGFFWGPPAGAGLARSFR